MNSGNSTRAADSAALDSSCTTGEPELRGPHRPFPPYSPNLRMEIEADAFEGCLVPKLWQRAKAKNLANASARPSKYAVNAGSACNIPVRNAPGSTALVLPPLEMHERRNRFQLLHHIT